MALEHRDVADPVVLGQVEREREAVHAAADDHDVVTRLQLAAAEELAATQQPGHASTSAQSVRIRSSMNAPSIAGTRIVRRPGSTRTFAPIRATSPWSEARLGERELGEARERLGDVLAR